MKWKWIAFNFCILFGLFSFNALLQAEDRLTNGLLRSTEQIQFDQQLLSDHQLFAQKDQILSRALETIRYLGTAEAEDFYYVNFGGDITASLVRESLLKFYLILLFSPDVTTLSQKLSENFAAYKSIGQDGKGSVLFTGYYQPVYNASRFPNDTYRYPLFKKPADFDRWSKPHPTRVELEGYDGSGADLLAGNELVWLANRFDVFMVQVQGSAILQLTDGDTMSIGYAAGTDYPFRGISADFLRTHEVAWDKLDEFFYTRGNLLNQIMSRNNRFIFFEEKNTEHAIGSLGVPVLAERTIATDRLKLPPGAVAMIQTKLPVRQSDGSLVMQMSNRLVLNLDTGSALKGHGRVDVFMGSGDNAKQLASSVYSRGALYYLFLR